MSIQEESTDRSSAEAAPETVKTVGFRIPGLSDLRARLFYKRNLEQLEKQIPGHVVVMLGPPASGKGTQASKLEERLPLKSVSTGDLLRAAVQKGDELGKRIAPKMERGEFIDDETVKTLLGEALSQFDKSNGLLLDGFPRTAAQCEMLQDLLEQHGFKLFAALELDVSLEESLRRMQVRRSQAKDGEERADDQEETLRRRYSNFEKAQASIREYFSVEKRVVVPAEGSVIQSHRRLVAGLARVEA